MSLHTNKTPLMKKMEREAHTYQQWKRHIGGLGNPVRRTLPKPKEDKFTWMVNRIKEDSSRDWEKEWQRRYEGIYQREPTIFTLFPSDQSDSLMSEEERKRYTTLLDKYLERRYEPYVYQTKVLPYHKAVEYDKIEEIKRIIENDHLMSEEQERILVKIEKNPNDLEIEIEENSKKGKYEIERENANELRSDVVNYFVEYTTRLKERFLNILEFQMIEPEGERTNTIEIVIEYIPRYIQVVTIDLNTMEMKIQDGNSTKVYQIESILLTIEYDETVIVLRTTPIKESMKIIIQRNNTIKMYNGIINGEVKQIRWKN